MTCRYVLRRYVILPASRSPETVLFSNSYIGARHVMLVIYVTTNAVFPKTHANVIGLRRCINKDTDYRKNGPSTVSGQVLTHK